MKIFGEFLFWLHIAVIIITLLLGYYLKPLLMLSLIIIREIAVSFSHGCPLTVYQRQVKGLPEDKDFVQYALERLFRLHLTRSQARVLNYTILLSALLISVVRYKTFF